MATNATGIITEISIRKPASSLGGSIYLQLEENHPSAPYLFVVHCSPQTAYKFKLGQRISCWRTSETEGYDPVHEPIEDGKFCMGSFVVKQTEVDLEFGIVGSIDKHIVEVHHPGRKESTPQWELKEHLKVIPMNELYSLANERGLIQRDANPSTTTLRRSEVGTTKPDSSSRG